MQRRKFLATVGSLAAGSAAAIGTGAFTTASADRSVTVEVENDLNSKIALVPGGHSGIEINDDGELEIDLMAPGDNGVNINSTYTWGDPDDPAADHAFKIVNNDGQDYDDLILGYDLDDDSWVDHSTTYSNESFIRFDAFGEGDPDGYWASLKAPNNELGTPIPVSRSMPTSDPVDFEAGQEIYVVIDVDTTGSLATLDDDLTGTLTVTVEGPGGN
ncbi:DUF1102 family protein [Halanaeroarchaeum sp. HSR-CO]|uniref:hypothetical protein n=1 Tax=Halanaeroarchaeum sp. HSR-CO TaxID=2866382 RepID=UPI00217E4CA5|nr:hypothetical protein [Halanaeroarchaeum sp. HSR-CO]UWG46457.1 DUF1102 family protein [Halanaeroarchaeum sp. HSR-CO]